VRGTFAGTGRCTVPTVRGDAVTLPPLMTVLLAILAGLVAAYLLNWFLSHLIHLPPGCAVVVLRKGGGDEVERLVLATDASHTFVNPMSERHRLLDMGSRVIDVDLPGAVTTDEGRAVRFTIHAMVWYSPVQDPIVLQRVAGGLVRKAAEGLDALVRAETDRAMRAVLAVSPPLGLARGDGRQLVCDVARDRANAVLMAAGLVMLDIVIRDLDDDDGYFARWRAARAKADLDG
jgi:uncharacterized membrane protein YqiK